MNWRRVPIVCLSGLMLMASTVQADVKTEERTRIEFPGVLGGIMKTFGGKAAREGIISKVALRGDRKMSITDETAELIDLKEEKVYQIDLKKKTYTVLTFEEMRRKMQETMEKASGSASSPKDEPPAKGQQPEFAVDFKIKESGQTKTINGYDAREVVATVIVREKNKSAEEGSMVVTSSMWLAPRIAAMKELSDFDRRYAEKLYLPFAREMAEQMAPAMGMYPGLQDAMGKLEAERVNMDGTAVLTTVRAEAAANPNQPAAAAPAQQNKGAEAPKSLGGLLGGLGRKAAGKDAKADNADAGKPAAFMTTSHELLSVSTNVSDADVSIPAGFKEKK